VNACPTHGALLGGYVLGSLEPAEMDEMRLHVADCPYCGPESRALGALPALLDTIEPADVPPPALSPSVEEAVLDRFAGGPVGVESLAALLGEERETIEAVYEPFLVQSGYLERTPRGRMATQRCWEYFGRERPAGPKQGRLL